MAEPPGRAGPDKGKDCKVKRIVMAACAALTLTGCKAHLTAQAKASDAIAAAAGQSHYMTAILGVEASSDASCRRDGPKVAAAIGDSLGQVAFLGCNTAGMDTMAEFRIGIPMIFWKQGDPDPETALTAFVQNMDGFAVVGLYQANDVIEAILDRLPADVTSGFPGRFDTSLTIDLQNDTSATKQVYTNGAFVDGHPLPFRKDRDLAAGASLRIVPGDVATAVLDGPGTFLFSVKLAE